MSPITGPINDPILPDHPAGPALLDAARRALLDEVAPALSGRQRFVVLMAASAIGIALRETEQADASVRAWARALGPSADASADPLAALAAAIRDGRLDADADLHRALTETAEVGARIYGSAPAATGNRARSLRDTEHDGAAGDR